MKHFPAFCIVCMVFFALASIASLLGEGIPPGRVILPFALAALCGACAAFLASLIPGSGPGQR